MGNLWKEYYKPCRHVHVLICTMYQIDQHLGSGPLSPDAPRPLFDRPFVPHIESWELRSLVPCITCVAIVVCQFSHE